MNEVATGILQEAATVDAAETLIGQEIGCGSYDILTLFFDYTKGDETGLYIVLYIMHESSGTAYQWQEWSAAAGDRTKSDNRLYVTASGNYYATFDVRGIEFVKFMNDANGGTPTGTLAAAYTMTAE